MALHSVDPHGEKGIHVSFDIDALDALEVPSTGTAGDYLLEFMFIGKFKYVFVCFSSWRSNAA